jgi:hypothetical protein
MAALSPRRALAIATIAVAFLAAVNAAWMMLAWTPTAPVVSARLSVGLVLLLAIAWGATARPAVAAAGAFSTSLASGAAFVIGFVLPSPGRARWCAAPDNYCEDGLLAVAVPLMCLFAGVLAAAVAATIAALRRSSGEMPKRDP